ncbi:MAG: superoxide dismutase [Bryobacterales bacterium]|nr:superoxide dismutase [Bryobacterales bacterium]
MTLLTRRSVLGVLLAGGPVSLAAQPKAAFSLPSLPYAYDALEPHIDARTMEIHHSRHHAAYVNNLNAALAAHPNLQGRSLEELVSGWSGLPEGVRTAVRNHGGGHLNHSLFWQMMSRKGGAPKGELARAIDQAFGSFDRFQEQFTRAAMGVFGSGWAWLAMDANRQLRIESTPNQDNPATQGRTALLGLDVWEHAYYLKYQNRRADYVAAFHNVIDWDFVADRYRTTGRS